MVEKSQISGTFVVSGGGHGPVEVRVFGCLHEPVVDPQGSALQVFVSILDDGVPVLYPNHICRKCRSVYAPDDFFQIMGVEVPPIQLEETMTLLTLKDVPPSRIVEQIEVRRRLMDQMVGTLYKGIVFDEMCKLEERRRSENHRGIAEVLHEHRIS